MSKQPTFLGTIQDVKGHSVSVSLSSETLSGFVYVNGQGYRIGQLGSFVRIPIGYIDLFGIVSQAGASAVPEKLVEKEPHGFRWMTVQMIGEGQRKGQFKRGISQYPTIGDEVHLVTEDELSRIYGQPDKPYFVRVGHIASAESIPALVDINKLVTRHSAVLGTTGTGKSTTVAGLLTSLSNQKRYPSSRIIVFDIHGEYGKALKDRASIFRVNPSEGELPLHVPYWAMNFDELISVTFGNTDEKDKGAILEKVMELKKNTLENAKKNGDEFLGVTPESMTVDAPIPFSIHQLWFDLHRIINSTHTEAGTGQSFDVDNSTEAFLLDDSDRPIQLGDPMKVIPPIYRPQTSGGTPRIYLSSSALNIKRQLEGLASKLRDPRFDFLFKPGEWLPDIDGRTEEDLDTFIKKWIGGDNPITILDLSGVPNSILNQLVGILLRIIYDALFWARDLSVGGRERPLLVILEEAHAYLNQGNKGIASTTVQRIVKEGRKYGVGAMIISQRPSEIDPTILSQCGTFFAMRLSNHTDRSHVTGTVTDNLEGLLSMLPVLRTGEAIILGESVHLPMRTLIDPPAKNRRPDSNDPVVYDEAIPEESKIPGGWNRTIESNSDYKKVVTVWRAQNPKYIGRSMEREAVSSTNIASIGYDPETNTLEIEFRNETVYQYFDVPQHVYEELRNTGSHGKYFAENIRGVYRYARI